MPAFVAFALVLGLALGCWTPPRDPTGMPRTATDPQRSEARRLLTLSLEDYIENTIRVQRISDALRVAGVELCGKKTAPVLGVAVIGVGRLPSVLQLLAAEHLGGRDNLRVVAVFDGFPASSAGVQLGDELLVLNGTRLKDMARLARVRHRSDGRDVELRIRRGEVRQTLPIRSLPGCRFPASVRLTQHRNAFTDAREIWISSGLIRHFDDSRLAYVIGHEMGHSILRRVRNHFDSGPKVEVEADYIGAYLSARAGFELIDTDLFERLQRDLNSLDQARGRSHPATHERTIALRKTVAEIRAKVARGESLVPEIR